MHLHVVLSLIVTYETIFKMQYGVDQLLHINGGVGQNPMHFFYLRNIKQHTGVSCVRFCHKDTYMYAI